MIRPKQVWSRFKALLGRARVRSAAFLRRVWNWSRALFSWSLWESRLYWGPPAIAVAAACLPWWGCVEQRVRLAGLALQLGGIAAVFVQIERTRAHFGHKTFGARVRAWFARCPLCRGRAQVAVADFAEVVVQAHDAHAFTTPPDLEGRVKALEKEMEILHKRIDKEVQAQEDAIERERRARGAGDERILTDSKTAATKDLHVAEAGAAWLLVGVVLSTAAPELSAWFN